MTCWNRSWETMTEPCPDPSGPGRIDRAEAGYVFAAMVRARIRAETAFRPSPARPR